MSEERMEDASPEPCTRQQPRSTVQQFLEEEATESETSELTNSHLEIAKPCKAKGFALKGTRLFLTYPQCLTTKEEALMRVKEHFKDNLKGYLIAQELHKGEASLLWL